VTDILDEDVTLRVDCHVGALIRHRRRELGISQTQLGDTLGVSFQQVQKYEVGANRVSASTLWRISRALDVTPGYWFDGLPGDDAEAVRYDLAAQLLLTDDGQNLARAYTEIDSRSARLALVAIARELASHGRVQTHAGAAPGGEQLQYARATATGRAR